MELHCTGAQTVGLGLDPNMEETVVSSTVPAVTDRRSAHTEWNQGSVLLHEGSEAGEICASPNLGNSDQFP
jgi:hypothetical protein